MVKVMRCHQCQHDFSWDSGNPLRGNIFICEDCGEFICYSCLIEHGYDVSNMDSILCLNCLKDKKMGI